VEALRRRGHELVPFRPHSEGKVRLEEIRGADWSFHVSQRPSAPKPKAAAPEQGPAAKAAEGKVRAAVLPAWARRDEPIHPDLAANAGRHPGVAAEKVEHVGAEGAPGLQRLLARRDGLRERFYGAWRQAGLDALVCPVMVLPACQVEEVRRLSKLNDTVRVFNFMDMPAGAVSVTAVTEEDLRRPYEPEHPDPGVSAAARRCLEGAAGLPVAVQVAALPWREELVLRVMREVQAACPFQGNHAHLQPVPRRSPTLGARPEAIPRPPAAKL